MSKLRRNMVEQQIRAWDVLDEEVLSLYDEIRREDFVPPAVRGLAYADMMLPIGDGQVMLEPKLEARMLQELAPRKDESILHIGCGSGFFAALLGRLAGAVVSAEIRAELAESAAERIRRTGAATRVVHADAAHGLEQHAPYDAIVLTGSLPSLPAALLAQLRDGGRLLAVVGVAAPMRLQLVEKRAGAALPVRDILETGIPPLENAPACPKFIF